MIVGGGNTFQLLKQCRERGLLAPITDVVKRGALYIGWSAGANLEPFVPDMRSIRKVSMAWHFTNALPDETRSVFD